MLVLTDGDAVLSRSLRRVLDSDDDFEFELVGEAADLSIAARHVHDHVPYVLVLASKCQTGRAST